jgi:hypothetical protein
MNGINQDLFFPWNEQTAYPFLELLKSSFLNKSRPSS